MSIITPQPFGKYLLMKKIAVGGMAEIFLARALGAEGFQKEVVIKRILPSFSDDEAFVKMFIDEARISARLHHPNIVQIYDFDKIEDCYYIAMEYVEGRDLRKIMDQGIKVGKPIPVLVAVHIAAEISAALKYAHTRKDETGKPLNIVHRDVSPHNILISYAGEVKLTDFGIAKAAARSTKTRAGTVKGKCGYMSPEQAKGKELDGRSDMFALCTILAEMLTRKKVFEGDTDFEILSKVLHEEVPPPSSINPDVPRELDEIVLRGLRKNRDERYPDMATLEKELRAFELRHAKDVDEWAVGPYLQEIFADEIATIQAVSQSFQITSKQGEKYEKRTLIFQDEGGGTPISEDKTIAVPEGEQYQGQANIDVDEAPTINLGAQGARLVQEAILARKQSETKTRQTASKNVKAQVVQKEQKGRNAGVIFAVILGGIALGMGGYFAYLFLEGEEPQHDTLDTIVQQLSDAYVSSEPEEKAFVKSEIVEPPPPKKLATLELNISPPNAKVKVNGDIIEGGAKRILEKFYVGDEVFIEISAPGYKALSLKKVLASDKEKTYLQLEKIQVASPPTPTETGQVLINARPWANVYYKGKNLGTTPVKTTVPVGKQTFVLKKDNVTKTITLEVKKDSTASTVVSM